MINKECINTHSEETPILASTPPEIQNLLIPQDKEKEFCDASRVILERCDNGAVIVAAPFDMEGQMSAEIRFIFPGGSYLDLKEKSGTAHLLEHLMAYPILEASEKHACYANASTSNLNMEFVISGIANPDQRDIGVWSPLEKLLQAFIDPETAIQMPFEREELEKGNVQKEANEYVASHSSRVNHELSRVLLADGNPLRINILGSEEDLVHITHDDLLEMAKKTFISNGLVVSIVTGEHDKPIASSLVTYVKDFVENIPKKESSNFVPLQRYLLENPNFEENSPYVIDTDLGNGIITVSYVWRVNGFQVSPEIMGLSMFSSEVNNEFFRYIRQSGQAYVSDASYISLSYKSGYFKMSVNVDAQTLTSYLNSYPDMIHQVFENITEESVQKKQLMFEKTYLAQPNERERRIRNAIQGLMDYDAILDTDKLITIFDISLQDTLSWKDHFLSMKPTVVIIGDLSKVKGNE